MRNLISSDFYKVRKGKYAFICTVLGLLLIVAFVGILYANAEFVDETGLVGYGHKMLREGFLGNDTNIGMMGLFFAIAISIFVGSEFGFGTIKNSATKAYSRVQIYVSKLVVSLILMTIMAILAIATGAIAGTLAFGWGTPVDGYMVDAIWNLLLQLYLAFALVSIFVMVAILIRQSGGSIAANICILMFIPTIIMFGSILLEKLFDIEIMLTKYFPSAMIAELGMMEALDQKVVIRVLVTATLWLAGTIAIGLFTFQKRDVK